MKEEKDEFTKNGRNNEKVLCQAVIHSRKTGILKNGHVKQADENRPVYETPRSVSILQPYKKARGSPCKGPPGRTRSPGVDYGYFTEHTPSCGKTKNSAMNSNPIFYEFKALTFRHLIKYKFLLFYKHLNFTIMKKQFLSIVLLAFALIGVTKANAQDLNYVNGASAAPAPVTTLGCVTEDALHPLPGKIYTYNVTVNPGVTTGNVQWFVYNATTNNSIITGGSIAAALAAAEPDGGTSQFLLDAENAKYKSATNTSGTIDVSWQSFNGTANRILLVAYVQGNGNCSDNIEVFRIEPTFSFTLDIAGIMPDGTLPASGNANECVSPVQSATYDGTSLTMDYGNNYIFFTVTAANFVHSWQPTFTLTNNTQSTITPATDITWAYPTEAIKTTGGTWNAVTAPVLAQATGGAVGATGEHIIVRVQIDHNNFENDANAVRSIILGVDGIMYNVTGTNYTTASLQDLDPGASAPCTNTVTDQATYDLTPRPELTTTILPAPGFEPKN